LFVFSPSLFFPAAYKDADGLKLEGRRILVDVERGRTVDDWKPTRLGGGLGGLGRKKKAAPTAPETSFGPPGGCKYLTRDRKMWKTRKLKKDALSKRKGFVISHSNPLTTSLNFGSP